MITITSGTGYIHCYWSYDTDYKTLLETDGVS